MCSTVHHTVGSVNALRSCCNSLQVSVVLFCRSGVAICTVMSCNLLILTSTLLHVCHGMSFRSSSVITRLAVAASSSCRCVNVRMCVDYMLACMCVAQGMTTVVNINSLRARCHSCFRKQAASTGTASLQVVVVVA